MSGIAKAQNRLRDAILIDRALALLTVRGKIRAAG
jgi:hypothetical protein